MTRGKRKRSTWGSVERLPSGRWRVRWWESTPKGWRRRSETIDGTRVDAERRLAQLRVAAGDAKRVPTVGQVWDAWARPAIVERVRATTLAKYDGLWTNYLCPRWAAVPCDQVAPADVQSWLDTMSAPVAKQSLALLRRILDRAVEMDATPRNRATGDYVLRGETRHQTREVLSAAQLAEVCRAARGHYYEAAVILQAYGGCRVGESLGVRANEVTDEGSGACSVSIMRSIGPTGDIRPTKTKTSVRAIIVCCPWGARLLELAAQALKRGEVWLCDDGAGRPIGQANLDKHWRSEVLDACPDVPRVPMRNLRPSFETMMHYEVGIELATVQRLMGHSSPRMTYQVYDRPDSSRLAGVLAGVDLTPKVDDS